MRRFTSRFRRARDSRQLVFEVGGMSCGSCVARIEGILSAQPGVTAAQVDLASRRARVTTSEGASPERMVEAVAEAGYTLAPADGPEGG